MNKDLLVDLNFFCDEICQLVMNQLDGVATISSAEIQECLEELEDRLGPGPEPDQLFFVDTSDFEIDTLTSIIELEARYDTPLELTVSVAVWRNQEVFSVSADNVAIDGTSPGIHLNIFLTSAQEGNKERTRVIDEITNSIRHELEHHIQDDYSGAVDTLAYHKIVCPPSRNPSSFYLYLVQPSEVAAHVRGYEAVAEKREDFCRSIQTLFEGYQRDGLITEDEAKRVFSCWEDWFDRNTYLN